VGVDAGSFRVVGWAAKTQQWAYVPELTTYVAVVQTEFRYRGRNISGAETESVRQLIAAHPGLSRRRLSAKLCQSWNQFPAPGRTEPAKSRRRAVFAATQADRSNTIF
jgi:hypothetical protein